MKENEEFFLEQFSVIYIYIYFKIQSSKLNNYLDKGLYDILPSVENVHNYCGGL